MDTLGTEESGHRREVETSLPETPDFRVNLPV